MIAICALGWPWRALGRMLRLPPAVSLMGLGILLGSAFLDVLPDSYLLAAPELSKIAFVCLLLRAALGLDPRTLRAIAVPGVALGILPVAAEIAVVSGLSRALLFERLDLALLAGFLVAAVSPAVVLPTMLSIKIRGLGAARFVPDLNMAQTVTNAFVAQTGIVILLQWISPDAALPSPRTSLLLLPVSVLLGVAAGWLGEMAVRPLLVSRARSWIRTAILWMAGNVLYFVAPLVHVAGVFAVLTLGARMRLRLEEEGAPVREPLRRAWLVAEIVLFVNLGAAIELERLAGSTVPMVLLVIVAALAVRVACARLLLLRSRFTRGERDYVALAHLPKATLQAVFGAVPLATFLRHGDTDLVPGGQMLLVMAVLAIVTTAPIGAVLLERTADRLLGREAADDAASDGASGAG